MLKKLALSAVSICMILSLSGCKSKDPKEEQKAFDNFITDTFASEMQKDFFAVHNYMENPDSFGIDSTKVKPQFHEAFSDKQKEADRKELEKRKETFEEFDRDLLSDKQKSTYDTFAYMLDLEEQLSDEDHQYLIPVFSSKNGVHIQVKKQLEDFTVFNENDVKSLISLVSSSKAYLNSALSYLKKQQKEDTVLIDKEAVLSYCADITENKEKSDFYKTLEKKISSSSLDKKKKASYTKQLKEAFTSSLLPAYETIVSSVSALDEDTLLLQGISELENGGDYYELLFRLQSGSERSISDTADLLDELISEVKEAEMLLASKDINVYENWLDNKIKTEYKSIEDINKALETYAEKNLPKITIKPYAVITQNIKEKQNEQVTLYPFAMDASEPIRIILYSHGGQMTSDSLQTYSILSQTAASGIMYQTLYNYEKLPNTWLKLCSKVNGLRDGFAIYSASNALNQLENTEKRAVQLQRKDLVLKSALLARADIGIHEETWSLEEFKERTAAMNWDMETTQAMYKEITANPGAYLSAGVGYLEISELQKEAKSELGKTYNEKEFTEALLKNGNAPFSVIEESVEDYISSK